MLGAGRLALAKACGTFALWLNIALAAATVDSVALVNTDIRSSPGLAAAAASLPCELSDAGAELLPVPGVGDGVELRAIATRPHFGARGCDITLAL